jgi:hypothetical protein
VGGGDGARRRGAGQGFARLVEDMRAATEGQTLQARSSKACSRARDWPRIYRSEKDGSERLENLEELVNAAESFVTQEGFGKDAVALPVDESGAAEAAGARRRDRRDHVAAGRLPDPRRRWKPATTRPRPGRTRSS